MNSKVPEEPKLLLNENFCRNCHCMLECTGCKLSPTKYVKTLMFIERGNHGG